MNRRIRIGACASAAAVGFFVAGFFVGRNALDTNVYKELVIQHLRAEWPGIILDTSHFAIKTLDRRKETISVTGLFRTTQGGNTRVGRFWVELERADSSWKPKTVSIRSMSDSNAKQLRWP
jgi:hypothetical protein